MLSTPTSPWAVILAGGEGTRLRPLTQRLMGDARPKQFCRLFGSETLLERTRRRADLIIRPDRQLVVVTATHAPHYGGLVREMLPGRLLVQPQNRGTAPAILLGALAVSRLAGDAPIAILPSDHDVQDEAAFMHAVAQAIDAVTAHRDMVILLGVEARDAETDYGWVEPRAGDGPVMRIRRFWEKPSAALARILLERGCLWNSFVMVGRAHGFRRLIAATLPGIAGAIGSVESALGTPAEDVMLARAYAELPTIGFSEGVVARVPERLSVLRVKDVGWSDLGNPKRAVESARRRGHAPPWLAEAASLSA